MGHLSRKQGGAKDKGAAREMKPGNPASSIGQGRPKPCLVDQCGRLGTPLSVAR